MLLVTGTADLLQLITTAAVATHVQASYVDNNAGTITPGRTNTIVSTATTTTVVGSPGSGIQRNVKHLSVRAVGGAQGVTVQHTDGTNVVILVTMTLQQNETLVFSDGTGFQVLDANGAVKVAQSGSGRYLATQVVTAGTTITTGSATTKVRFRMVGGGGGGAGCTSVASAASAGGGGGAGGYLEKIATVTPNTGYTCAIGSAGAGASGAAGGNGGNTTLAIGGTTYTANGGSGAPVATALTTLIGYAGGAGGAISTNGDVNSAGVNGIYGVVLVVATPVVASGNGGDSPFGRGGLGLTAAGNGNNGAGYGSGGGGAATGASAVRTGGNGMPGIIILDEFA